MQPGTKQAQRRLLLSLAVAACAACGSSSATRTTPAETGASAGGESSLRSAAALRLLPADTPLVAVGRDARAIARAIGWPDLLRERRLYERAVAEVVEELGVNVLSLDRLAEIGIDVEAPFGVAWLPAEEGAGALFATASDPERFKEFVYRVSEQVGEKFEPRWFGDGLALVPRREDEVAFLLRDDQIFLIVADEGDDLEALLERIGSAAPDRSLAASDGFRDQVAAADFGPDLGAYLDPGWFVRWGMREGDEERALLEHLVTPAGPITLGATLSAESLEVRLRLRPRPGSIPDQLFGEPGSMTALRLGGGAPALAFGWRARPEGLLALAGALGGGDLDEALQRVGWSAEEAAALVTGELGMALLPPENPTIQDDAPPPRPRLFAYLGLTDGDRIPAALRALFPAARPRLPWGERAKVALVGDHLVLAADPHGFSPGEEIPFSGELAPAERKLLERSSSLKGVADVAALYRLWSQARQIAARRYAGAHRREMPEAEDVTFSEKVREMERELERLDQEIERAMKAWLEEQRARREERMKRLGLFVGSARRIEGDVLLEARSSSPGSLRALSSLFFEVFAGGAGSAPARVMELESERWRLRSELRARRRQEIEEHRREEREAKEEKAETKAGETKAAELDPDLPSECHEYISAMETYMQCDKVPDAAREAQKKGLEQMKKTWGSMRMTKETERALKKACGQGLKALKQAASASGCSIQ